MVLGVTALFLASSYNVQAEEVIIYKCARANGQVQFQNLICPSDTVRSESVRLEMNQSADNPAGLREHETTALARAHERQMQERELNNKIHVAKINSDNATQQVSHTTAVHVYPATPAYYVNNQNQNSISIKYTKTRK